MTSQTKINQMKTKMEKLYKVEITTETPNGLVDFSFTINSSSKVTRVSHWMKKTGFDRQVRDGNKINFYS